MTRRLQGRMAPWVLGLLSLLYVLPMYNKWWSPYDEGFILSCAQRILSGELPYRDFWIQMAPGQFYLLAGLYKVFGMSLVPGRLLTVCLHGITCGVAFALARQLFGARLAVVTWCLCTLSLIGRLGPSPWPSWTAMCVGLISAVWLVRSFDEGRGAPWHVILAGFLAGIAGWFRQDLGGYTWAAGVSAVALVWLARGRMSVTGWALVRRIGMYSVAAAVPVGLAVLWAWWHGILAVAIDNTIRYPMTVYSSARGIAWPRPIFNPLMLFHQGMVFIQVNQFYLPILVYALAALALIRRWRDGVFGEREAGILAVVLLGAIWLNHAGIRSDLEHLVPVLAPTFIVLPMILPWWSTRAEALRAWLPRRLVVGLVVGLLAVPLTVRSIHKYLQNVYKKPLRGQIEWVDFHPVGQTYLPARDAAEVAAVVRLIRERTPPSARIYVGRSSHWNPQGAPLMFYFLGQRLPATQYHVTAPGVTETTWAQREMMMSLALRAALVILEDVPGDTRLTALDRFIQDHFDEVVRIGRYRVLEPS